MMICLLSFKDIKRAIPSHIYLHKTYCKRCTVQEEIAATAVKRNFPMIEDMKAAGEKDFVIQFRTEDAAGTITIQPKSILVVEKIG